MSNPEQVIHQKFVTIKLPCACGGTISIQNYETDGCSRELLPFLWSYCDKCMRTHRCKVLKETITIPATGESEVEVNANAEP